MENRYYQLLKTSYKQFVCRPDFHSMGMNGDRNNMVVAVKHDILHYNNHHCYKFLVKHLMLGYFRNDTYRAVADDTQSFVILRD